HGGRRSTARDHRGADARAATPATTPDRAPAHRHAPGHHMTRQATSMATETIETPQDAAPEANLEIHARLGRKYDAGFVTDIESDSLPAGLDEDVIRALSLKKE